MKKYLLAATLSLLVSCNAYAYKDLAHGYEVNDKNAVATLNTYNTFGYSEKAPSNIAVEELAEQNTHFVSVFTADDLKDILEESFTSDYFYRQYEKLDLLQRSELSLQTLPVPIIEFAAFTNMQQINSISVNEYKFGKEQLDLSSLKPQIRIDKAGKYKIISCLYTLKQKDNSILVSTSFLTDKDRLFVLSSTYNEYCKPDDKTDPKQTDISNYDVKILDMKDVSQKTREDAWKNHLKFVKSFKTFKYTNNPSNNKYGFYDNILKKEVELPQDWIYKSVILKDKDIDGKITVAMPQSVIIKLSADETVYQLSEEILGDLTATEDNDILSPQADYQQILSSDQVIDYSKGILNNVDKLLLNVSFKSDKENFKDFFVDPIGYKQAIDLMLYGMASKINMINSPYFGIHDFDYLVNMKNTSGSVMINSKMRFFDDINFSLTSKFAFNKEDEASSLIYMSKSDDDNKYLTEKINTWEF